MLKKDSLLRGLGLKWKKIEFYFPSMYIISLLHVSISFQGYLQQGHLSSTYASFQPVLTVLMLHYRVIKYVI